MSQGEHRLSADANFSADADTDARLSIENVSLLHFTFNEHNKTTQQRCDHPATLQTQSPLLVADTSVPILKLHTIKAIYVARDSSSAVPRMIQ